MNTPFSQGNRMHVPAAVRSKHFFYKAAPVEDKTSLALAAKVGQGVLGALEAHGLGLNPAQIDVMSRKLLERDAGVDCRQALDDLVERLGLSDLTPKGSLLFCEWASPHVDDSYAGSAFVSIVLRTGPEPYVMQTFHHHVVGTEEPSLQLETSTRVLNVGDVVVFDPTTPHLAIPRHAHQDQLLVLLQFELPDRTLEDRQALLERFAPAQRDLDEQEVFNGYI